MPYDFMLVDVFTDTLFGGNQLAVLPDARGLTARQMQDIAHEFNLAETAFVIPSNRPDQPRALRIFTPLVEMAFAGHPTVGAAAALAHLGVVASCDGRADVVFDEHLGPVSVSVRTHPGPMRGELLLDEAALDEPDERPSSSAVAHALSLRTDAVLSTWFGSVGLPFCFAELASREDVDAANLDRTAFTSALGHAWAHALFFYAGDPRDGVALYARMFAPDIGIDEDPATGSAAATLAGHIANLDPRPNLTVSLQILQGVRLGRRSVLTAGATKTDGTVRQVSVGGGVVVFGQGRLDVEPER